MPETAKKFKAKLVGLGEGGSWPCLKIPFKVEKVWGSRARVAVRGRINGFAFRSSIFPDGRGNHILMVNQALRAGARAATGDTIRVEMAPDTAPRVVRVPADLRRALGRSSRAKAAFDGYPYSHKKAYVDWVVEAKQAETRRARIEKAVKMMAAGKKRM